MRGSVSCRLGGLAIISAALFAQPLDGAVRFASFASNLQEGASGPGALGEARREVERLRGGGNPVALAEALVRLLNLLPAEPVSDAELLEQAATQLELGWLLLDLGSREVARPLLASSAQTRQRILSPDDPKLAAALSAYARCLREDGRHEDALPLFREANRIFETAKGLKDPDTITSSNNLATALWDLGRLEEALPILEQIVSLWTGLEGPDSPYLIQAFGNLAELNWAMGRYAASEEGFRNRNRVIEIVLGPESLEMANSLERLGELLRQSGNSDGAGSSLERALDIRRRALGGEHLLVADTLESLGLLRAEEGRDEEAVRTLLEALQIRRKIEGNSNPEIAFSMGDLANILRRQRRFEEAADLYEEAKNILEAAYGPQDSSLAPVLNSLGILRHQTGKREDASQLYRRALSIWRQQLGDSHPNVAAALSNLSAVLAELGHSEEALRQTLEAEEIGRGQLRLTIATQPVSVALRYAEARPSGLDLAFSLAVERAGELPMAVPMAWDSLIRSRALAADELAALRHSNTDRRVEVDSAGLREVLSKLPSGTVLVAFVAYRHHRLSEEFSSERAYLALVGHSDGRTQAVPLGRAEEIESLVDRWRGLLLAYPSSQEPATAEGAYRQLAGRLRELVWDPIQNAVAGFSGIYLVPDSSLNLVTFETLPEGEDRYLADSGPTLHYLSAERDLAGRAAEVSGRGLLVLEGADFDSAPIGSGQPGGEAAQPESRLAECGSSRLHFEGMAWGSEEAEAVLAIWRERTPSGSDGEPSHLSGESANELEFRRQVRGKGVLHLATHLFVLGSCERPAGSEGGASPPSPFERAGLALTGANQRERAPASNDGVLTAGEVAGLDLTSAEWVVATGCRHSDDSANLGESILGLRRAVQASGARVLVACLWPGSEDARLPLMSAFYRAHLTGGLDAAEALRQAERELLEQRRKTGSSTHPFHWGGFVATGVQP